MHVIAIGTAVHEKNHAFIRENDMPWWTISWLDKGSLTFTRILKAGRLQARVDAPSLIVIPPRTGYQVTGPRACETWAFIAPPSRWREWLDLPERLPGIRTLEQPNACLAPAFAILREVGDDFLLRDNAMERILLLARPARRLHPLVAAALAHLEADLGAAHDLRQLSRAAGGSRSRLAELFTAEVGAPPMAWLERRRIESASALLLATARSITDIADEVGFANPFHFSTRFRALTGMSPSRWRRNPCTWS